MKTFSPNQNFRQGIENYSSLLTGAPIANRRQRGSVVRQLRILVSQFRVLRTGTLSEIRPDNMYQPLAVIVKRNSKQRNR